MSISRSGGRGHVVGEPLEVVGGLAHRRNHHDDVVAVAPGAHDVVGDGADPVGIGDRRAAELLDEQSHDAQLYEAASPASTRDCGSVDCAAVPKATKRERQRQNRDMRREAMLAAEKRRKRFRTARTIGLLLIPIVMIFAIVQLTSGDDSGDTSNPPGAGIKCSNREPATPGRPRPSPTVPPTTID